MTELLLGALLGGAVFFVWSAISWMALPWQRAVYKPFVNEDAVVEVMGANAPEPGLYGLPEEPKYPLGATKEQRETIDRAVWEKLQKITVTAVVTHGGFPPLPRMLGVAFVTYTVVALLFCWMLSKSTGLLYGERVLFIAVAGLSAGLICRLPDWNWHQYPLNHTIVQIANLLVGWTLSGLVMAWLVKGATQGGGS
jgi:hypothetical protein